MTKAAYMTNVTKATKATKEIKATKATKATKETKATKATKWLKQQKRWFIYRIILVCIICHEIEYSRQKWYMYKNPDFQFQKAFLIIMHNQQSKVFNKTHFFIIKHTFGL